MRRRKERAKPQGGEPGQPPLQPTFLDRAAPSRSETQNSDEIHATGPAESLAEELQPEVEPQGEAGEAQNQPAARGRRTRRRGRGGRGRADSQPAAPGKAAVLPIGPGGATGEGAEVDAEIPGEGAQHEAEPVVALGGKPKGAVVLAIGLPGSGKSSWFKRHDIVPLSSDLIRGLLFDDPTEQRYQDLVFSSLRSLLRARLLANRPMNYIDATNLSPRERHSWIKMAHDYRYEAHAVFFDVPAEVCMERNRRRARNVPEDVMLRMAQKLRPPKFEEGFAKITVVRLKRPEPEGGE